MSDEKALRLRNLHREGLKDRNTPRQILQLKSKLYPDDRLPLLRTVPHRPYTVPDIRDLSLYDLDTPLDDEQKNAFLLSFLELTQASRPPTYRPVLYGRCAVCRQQRLHQTPRVSEYPLTHAGACGVDRVCRFCVVAHMRARITRWWADLEMGSWLLCPCCNLAIDDVFLRLPMASSLYAGYSRACRMREELRTVAASCSPGDIEFVLSLFDALFARGKLHHECPHNFAFPRVEPAQPGAENDVVSRKLLRLVARFVRRQDAKTCSMCDESIKDVEYTSREDWAAAFHAIDDNWVWLILEFPLKLGEGCEHEIDFCSRCLARHVEKQVDLAVSRGSPVCCPVRSCQRGLTWEEIYLYSDTRVFEKFKASQEEVGRVAAVVAEHDRRWRWK